MMIDGRDDLYLFYSILFGKRERGWHGCLRRGKIGRVDDSK